MDEADFTKIDEMVFDRLHRGPPGPVVVRLKGGTTVTGQLVAIHRSGAIGGSAGSPAGELSLVSASGPIAVRYDDIEAIA